MNTIIETYSNIYHYAIKAYKFILYNRNFGKIDVKLVYLDDYHFPIVDNLFRKGTKKFKTNLKISKIEIEFKSCQFFFMKNSELDFCFRF